VIDPSSPTARYKLAISTPTLPPLVYNRSNEAVESRQSRKEVPGTFAPEEFKDAYGRNCTVTFVQGELHSCPLHKEVYTAFHRLAPTAFEFLDPASQLKWKRSHAVSPCALARVGYRLATIASAIVNAYPA
jgi:hypothetical protein